MSSLTCSTCRFFEPGDNTRGRCLRYPPQIVMQDGKQYSSWPLPKKTDFCGEHSPQPTDRA